MPFVEFVVRGVPVSAQAKDLALKARYRQRVQSAAQQAMGDRNRFDTPVRLIIRIFCKGGARPDCDNVVKLVQDALEHIIYVNDALVDDLDVRRRGTTEEFEIPGTPKLLLANLSEGESFMYVCVTTDVPRAVIR
jgi:Holliday junction resolvase RusA-like endonuclease